MIRAVVFDFDGVLANSEPLHFRAFRDVLAARGIILTEREYYDRYLGYDDMGAFRAIGQDRHVVLDEAALADMIATKAERLAVLEREGSMLFSGARDAVERMAARCPVAIASGALKREIERVLEHEELTALFTVIVAAEDTGASKPAPDPYLRAVTLLSRAVGVQLRASECVAIEDSRWGLQSARDAGLRTIGITHTYPADELSEADIVIGSLDALDWPLLFALSERTRTPDLRF